MRAKINVLFVIVFLNLLVAGCTPNAVETTEEDQLIEFQKGLDTIAAARIDSAYKLIRQECDTARKYRLPLLVDSLLHLPKDSIAP
jgi:hypothetical protein